MRRREKEARKGLIRETISNVIQIACILTIFYVFWVGTP